MKRILLCQILLIFIIYFKDCELHDPALGTPDCCGKGYNLTPLGALIDGSWMADPELNGANISVYSDSTLLSSVGEAYTTIQNQLVFELLKNGRVRSWLRKDNQFRNLRTSGSWKANYKDSTIRIDLWRDSGIIKIKGKYMLLGNSTFSLSEVS